MLRELPALDRYFGDGRRLMRKSGHVPDLVVISGPIASGKSTVSHALGSRFRASGRGVAVLDVDDVVDVVDTIGGFGDLNTESWHQAQVVHGELVGAWLCRSFDAIAHGPFFERQEFDALLHAVPDGVEPRRVHLLATYEAALERVALDLSRGLSKDPALLRLTYDRVEVLLPTMPPSEWTFDTTATSCGEIVDALVAELLSDRS